MIAQSSIVGCNRIMIASQQKGAPRGRQETL